MPYVDDDQSASTAQFQAFAKGELRGPGLDDDQKAWDMGAPKSQVWKLVGIVVAVAVVLAVLAALMAS